MPRAIHSNKYGVKCPRCKSTEIWKTGYVPTAKGRKDRFKCTMCGHSFYKGQPGTIVGDRRKVVEVVKTVSPVKKLLERKPVKIAEVVKPRDSKGKFVKEEMFEELPEN